MKQVRLGQNGPMVSAVGYGAMSFTNFYGPATDEGSMRILDACVDLGITHVDTSNVYGMGRSETVIGDWLKKRGGSLSHREYEITETNRRWNFSDSFVAECQNGV